MAYANTVNISFSFKPAKGRAKKVNRTFGFNWKSKNYLEGAILDGENETCLVYYSRKFQTPVIINKKHHVQLNPEKCPEIFGAIMGMLVAREPEEYELV